MNSLKAIFLFVCTLGLTYTNASHVTGGYLSITPTGETNQYVTTLTLYSECGAANLPDILSVDLTNSCSYNDTAFNVCLQYITLSDQLCPADAVNSACNGGSLPQNKTYVYTGVFTLDGPCNYWTYSFRYCDRPPTINVSNSECFYIETNMNTLDYPLNSSPRINNLFEMPKVCSNTITELSSFASDPNADVMNFSLISALDNHGNPVSYYTPFTGTMPLPTIQIDQQSGQMTLNTGVVGNVNGNYVVAVLIEELDASGNLIGSVIHDFIVSVETCLNATPVANSVSNFNNFGTNSTLTNGVIEMCSGDEFCFDLTFNDTDANDTIILDSDISTILPGATFVQTGVNPATATVCWTHHPNFVGNTFTISAKDQSCPIVAASSQSFVIDMSQSIGLLYDTINQCSVNAAPQLLTNGNSMVNWLDVNGVPLDVNIDISCNPCSNPLFLISDTTVIASMSTGSPCNTIDTTSVYISSFTPQNSNLAPDTTFICQGDSAVFYNTNPSISYVWNACFAIDTIVITASTPTAVVLESYQMGGCHVFDTTLVYPYTPIPAIQYNTTQNLLSTGSFTSYQWNFMNSPIPGAINQTYSPNQNGDYSVTVIDSNGCEATSNMLLVTVGIDKVINPIKVYKSDQYLIIETPLNPYTAEVYNMAGQLISKTILHAEKTSIELPNNKQVYIVKVYSETDGLALIKKL